MAFISPLETLLKKFPDTSSKEVLDYEGSLDKVIACLKRSLTVNHAKKKHMVSLAIDPSRILRAVMDYKIRHPKADSIDEIFLYSIKTALGVYGRDYTARQDIDVLKLMMEYSGNKRLLKDSLKQDSDIATWNAMKPDYSDSSAKKLRTLTNDRDVLFIALGHGGVACGMDVYLRYCDITCSTGSTFYPVRFSTSKCKDSMPNLTYREAGFLHKHAEDREIVIFDEDVCSGHTMLMAHDFFSEGVFGRRRMIPLTNFDTSLMMENIRRKYLGEAEHLLENLF
jgi:hypothetical protein